MTAAIRTIPHAEQCYDTQGDWISVGGHVGIYVDAELSQVEQWCTMVHELVEAILCIHKWGSKATETVDTWDMVHQGANAEPGELPDCPYKREHTIANIVEEILRLELMK